MSVHINLFEKFSVKRFLLLFFVFLPCLLANRSIGLMHRTLIETTIPGLSGHRSNGNEWVFHTSQIFMTVTLSLDAVSCHTNLIIPLFLSLSHPLSLSQHIYIYIYTYIYHYDVVSLVRISLTFSRYSSISSIASGRSFRLLPVSVQSCCK